MARTCTVCTHPDRAAIDKALVAGVSVRDLASRYGTVGRMALQRHKTEHLPEALSKAQEAGEVARGDALLQDVRDLQAKAMGLLKKAEAMSDYRTALAGIREARACLELLAKLLGELDDRPQVNVLISPEWQALRGAILGALAPFPDARLAVATRIARMERVQ
jgi:hypothetical protein